MLVKALDDDLVNGYRRFVCYEWAKRAQGLLYHQLFSSNVPEFQSDNEAIQATINGIEQALSNYGGSRPG